MADTSAPPTAKAPAAGWLHWNFACITLLSAFLLFQVQPLASKCILPWFGGAPAVWTTCLLFFQTMLFAGYLYAHLLQRYLQLRWQTVVHVLLVAVAMVLLPIAPGPGWKPTDGSLPVGRITLLLAATVGLPYFALSATSPLVQAWFSRSCPGRSPYRLYALSNIGSLLALLTYPFLFEPKFDLTQQSCLWSASFALYAVLCAVCMMFLRKLTSSTATSPSNSVLPSPSGRGAGGEGGSEVAISFISPHPGPLPEGEGEYALPAAPTMLRRFWWLLLPACASLMLMATTNHVCQDIAVVPFLWVVPLAFYLLSFIVCFDHPRWYQRGIWATTAAVLVVAVSLIGTLHESSASTSPVLGQLSAWFPDLVPRATTYLTNLFSDFIPQLVAYFATLFVICTVCHGELARLKPDPRHLTEFYLMIAAGGALGGSFVSLLAPLIFNTFFEWEIGLVLSYLVATGALWFACRGRRWRWIGRALLLPPAAAGMCAMVYQETVPSNVVHRVRNFYGVVSVTDRTVSDPDTQADVTLRSLVHGWIVHGSQFLDPTKELWPITYYGQQSGVARAIEYFRQRGKVRLGAVGLGTGTLSAYARPGDEYRFYEINPQVPRIAQTYFTYLKNCQGRVEIIMGDARLSLERELQQGSPQGFQVLVLDAFSSDSIPTHLLTREALGVYLQHLAPGGVIAVHISNRYLDLAPVVHGLAADYGLRRIPISSEGDDQRQIDTTDWVLLTRNEEFDREMAVLLLDSEPDDSPAIHWTDQSSNLFQILRTK